MKKAVAIIAISFLVPYGAAIAQVSSFGTSPGITSSAVVTTAGGTLAAVTPVSSLSVPLNSNAFGNYATAPMGTPTFTTTMFDANGNAVLVRTGLNGAVVPNGLGYPLNGPVPLVSPTLFLNGNGLIQTFGVSNGPGGTTTALGSQYSNAASAGSSSINSVQGLSTGVNGFSSGPNGQNNGFNGANFGTNGQNAGTGIGFR